MILKYTQSLLAVLFLLMSPPVMGQPFHAEKLERHIQLAIAKGYSASVRIWGFDTVRNTRTSAQFTGVVVSSDGHILTAAHVNVPGNTYKVMFPDGRSGIAAGLGEIELEDTPAMPDVAMMKIAGNGVWPFAEMGWSSAIVKNEPCISIAYPESLDQALPMIRFGHIAEVKNQYGFIRSTCLMEPGDSGGPLFDYLGRVIGLHSAIDVAENDNFEIPVDLYRKYWKMLNMAKTYKSFPLIADSIGVDPLAGKIIAIPRVNNSWANSKLVDKLTASCLTVRSRWKEKAQQVRGTLIDMEGIMPNKGFVKGSIVISKSSLVGENPQVIYQGKPVDATVIARDKENDLVLLTTGIVMRGAVKLKQMFTDTVGFDQLGRFLYSPLGGDSCRLSILGSKRFILPKLTSIGYLGAQIAYFGPLLFTSVQPHTPASAVKLEKGDELLSINGVTIARRADYIMESKKYWPNDKVVIQVKRKDSTYSKEVVLEIKPQLLGNHPAELFAGGKSELRDGFKQVFAHDAKIRPAENGGPVFDLHGNFYGINIARYSRVSTVVVPASVLLNFIRATYF